jgi:hypothetical protein
MTQVCCPSCRLRFARAVGAYIVACPRCGEPPELDWPAGKMIGFRLAEADELFDALPEAIAVALPRPEPQ